MNVFISHSWRDKTTADMIAGDLADVASVWQDIQQLKPGDAIQLTIDEALSSMDMIVLLWSKYSADSRAVEGEIRTTKALGRKLVPCLLDDTPLAESISDILAIDFHDYAMGFGRLLTVILGEMAEDRGFDIGDEIGTLGDLQGVLTYLNDYKNRHDLSGDREYWIDRTLRSLNRVHDRIQRLQERMATAGDFVQQIYGKLESAGDDPEVVRDILDEVIRNEHIAPDLLSQVRGHIERYLATLPETLAATRKRIPPDIPDDFARFGSETGRELAAALSKSLSGEALDAAVDLLDHYISCCRPSLQVLNQLALSRQSMAGVQVVQHLTNYLENPNDLMPESELGVIGYLDDAWLIHNTAYRLVESGIIPADVFPVEWPKIVAADQIAVTVLQPMVRRQLEHMLQQFLMLIAAEIASYSPQFVNVGQSYSPLMGAGGAVGGVDRAFSAAWDSVLGDLGDISLGGWD